MMLKVKKEAVIPPAPKTEANYKALKTKKAVLKGVHSHKKEDLNIPHLAVTQDIKTLKFARKKTEDNNTLVFIVDTKAKKHQIKQAVKKLYDINIANVNTLLQPDGEKAYLTCSRL
ncbi:60S ribosomal protein L23a-like [Trichosurus vulpecula]|uniref:60S ribosomal protein L23a-like n=1 Tax=Trichosurus vulpecula TaxID=9337 RepID=UPI00186B1094|nr:60S ribosomal protein L23a-like [Trichosurus vulpecula]